MKKFVKIFLILSFLLVTGCSNKVLEKISIEKLNEKMENKETFIIYFADDKSDALEKTLINVLESNNLKGYKINTSKITNDEKLKLQTSIDYEEPSIVFIINGKDPSKLSHVKDSSTTNNQITQRLKDMGYIK